MGGTWNEMLRRCAACWLLLSAAVVHAQTEQQTQEPAAQAMMCGRDEPSSWLLPDWSESRVQAYRYSQSEQQCWISLEQARQRVEGRGAQWVDVRDAGQVQTMAAPGMLPVPLRDLKNRAYLRGLDLVLMGNGFDLPQLSQQCAALNQTGQFAQVSVAVGGLYAWQQSALPLRVYTAIPVTAPAVSAADFWQGARAGQWQLLSVGLSKDQRMQLPAAPALELAAGSIQALVQQMQRFLASAPSLPLPQQWIVVARNSAVQQQLQQAWHTHSLKGMPALSFLSGGMPTYTQYIDTQKLLAASAGKSLPKICGM